ncbi:MAG TPA: rod shape-determining protein MreC [Terracidiphilus sp.]|nr:rod shape-determining protein MreC [Terracidiphilus sp.]
MESFFVRYRNIVVLLTLLVAQILGLAVQVHRTDAGRTSLDPNDSSGVRLIRLWANTIVSPPEHVAHSSGHGVSWVWNNYFDLRHVRQQNQDLQETVDRLRLEEAALLEDARQGQRLQALLGFQEKYIYKTVPAQVLGTSGTDLSRVFNIDKGKDDGIARDMAVITPDGIVGKVRDVFPHSALVLAINDPTSGAGVILETTRTRGILRGNAFGQTQIVDIMADQRIKPGEAAITAGGDLIFPRGLPVGVVEKVVNDPDRDSFIDVIIKPAAHLDRLDEVLVITSTEPRFPSEQKQDIAASQALKASDLDEMNAQKKASDIMAERLPGLLDPNLPADQQPLKDDSNPNPIARVPQPLHPDRFSPGAGTAGTGQGASKPEVIPAKNAAHPPSPTAPSTAPDQPQPQREP